MNPSFDLISKPWVSCSDRNGRPIELGLLDTLAHAHKLREVQGESPLVTAALYRLLLAILHRVFGPADHDKWNDLWKAGRWDTSSLTNYFNQWQHRFDLFDSDRPFYQAADPRVRPRSVINLIHDVGNTPTLFDHHTEDEGLALSPAVAARMVVTAQAFGLAGLSGIGQKFTDGTCASGVLFLAEGGNLFETLALNLLPYPKDEVMPSSPDDRPCWEMDDPFHPDRSIPLGYLDYLTWQSRRILLLPETTPSGTTVVRQMTKAPALRLDDRVLDPMKHYRKDGKQGWLEQRFNEERALWRDSAALFRLADQSLRWPRVFRWLAELLDRGYLRKEQTLRCLALGMASDRAKVEFYRGERMPLPLDYLRSPDLVENLTTALQMAEESARQLRRASASLATGILFPNTSPKKLNRQQQEERDALVRQWAVERRYWSRLEVPFRQTMEAIPRGPADALSAWRDRLVRAAWEAFDPIADGLDRNPRTLRAEVQARGQLAAGLAKVRKR